MSEDESTMELALSKLGKKIDEQARFNRSLTVICTLTVLGVMFYSVSEIFNALPQLIVLQYLANMDKIVKTWKMSERANAAPPPKQK